MAPETAERIEATLDKPPEELEDELPELLDEIDGRTREFVDENPELFGRVVNRMDEIDVAAFVESNPETADQFQDLVWTGMEVVAENNEEVQEAINLDITVNFEADDCPMQGHLEIDEDERTITGGSGLLDDAELRISGPADTLVELITGEVDPVQGFMSGEYELEGPVPMGTQLAPVMTELSDQLDE